MDEELRQLVWQRAKDRCEYCHFPAGIALLPFQIDHIMPRKLGGATTPENLALSNRGLLVCRSTSRPDRAVRECCRLGLCPDPGRDRVPTYVRRFDKSFSPPMSVRR
jgi:hypothetical protein